MTSSNNYITYFKLARISRGVINSISNLFTILLSQFGISQGIWLF